MERDRTLAAETSDKSNIIDIVKRPQNGVFLVEKWHLQDKLVYKSIFRR